MKPPRWTAAILLAVAAAGCIDSSSGTTPIAQTSQPPELVFCRARRDQTHSMSEIAIRSAQNLGTGRIPERAGRELRVRLHPDGNRVVFARERQTNQPGSRELFVASRDGAVAELRLTANNHADDEPCWSPDGSAVLFSTTRDGDRRLYLCNADGSNARPFLSAAAGIADGQPDWHGASDRIVFSRAAPGGSRRLFLLNGDGSGLVPLTAGTAGPGDHEPAFAPDGGSVVFVRRTAEDRGALWIVDLLTGAERLLYDPAGDLRLPRFSPAGDRIFCGLSQPALGRPGPRLAVLQASGSNPVLIQPGREWLLDGLDVLPDMLAPRAAADPLDLDPDGAEIQIASGTAVLGGRRELRDPEGAALILATTTFDGREVAAINCRFTLPIAVPTDALVLRVELRARLARAGTNSFLRSSLYDPGSERFDTVVELQDPGTDYRTMTFATQSLSHVSRQRQVRFTVIGDIEPGGRSELHVDHVRLTLVRAASSPADGALQR